MPETGAYCHICWIVGTHTCCCAHCDTAVLAVQNAAHGPAGRNKKQSPPKSSLQPDSGGTGQQAVMTSAGIPTPSTLLEQLQRQELYLPVTPGQGVHAPGQYWAPAAAAATAQQVGAWQQGQQHVQDLPASIAATAAAPVEQQLQQRRQQQLPPIIEDVKVDHQRPQQDNPRNTTPAAAQQAAAKGRAAAPLPEAPSGKQRAASSRKRRSSTSSAGVALQQGEEAVPTSPPAGAPGQQCWEP